ncbi:hypothetical protein QR680_016689 [Steinernema hermaphroditum]|uniref:Uncharacterized protein n=1 Tax=Steinernema hermaphroditum TaxID=289476 RepID=A0AA39HBZ1_9BILA|nr:hypothetical protein QR680_016689 [Steinernema hermaphroditum]
MYAAPRGRQRQSGRRLMTVDVSVADRSHHDPRRQHPPEASESEFLDAASAAHGYELRFHRRRHLHQKQRLG